MRATTPPKPLPEKCAFANLGGDIETPRLRRRRPNAVMAERTFVARSTLEKIGRGNPGVSLGIDAAQSSASD